MTSNENLSLSRMRPPALRNVMTIARRSRTDTPKYSSSAPPGESIFWGARRAESLFSVSRISMALSKSREPEAACICPSSHRTNPAAESPPDSTPSRSLTWPG